MSGALVLAAGSSRRFGDDKRQARLPNGKLVIQQTLEHLRQVFDEVLVVLRHDDDAFAAQLAAQFEKPALNYFLAPDSHLGMGHSLAGAMGQIRDWEGTFVFLADMPFTQPATLAKLKRQLTRQDDIVIPVYQNHQGHPVGFGADYFGAMSQLQGDRGAKAITNGHPDKITEVIVTDPGVIQDVDTPADLMGGQK